MKDSGARGPVRGRKRTPGLFRGVFLKKEGGFLKGPLASKGSGGSRSVGVSSIKQGSAPGEEETQERAEAGDGDDEEGAVSLFLRRRSRRRRAVDPVFERRRQEEKGKRPRKTATWLWLCSSAKLQPS